MGLVKHYYTELEVGVRGAFVFSVGVSGVRFAQREMFTGWKRRCMPEEADISKKVAAAALNTFGKAIQHQPRWVFGKKMN